MFKQWQDGPSFIVSNSLGRLNNVNKMLEQNVRTKKQHITNIAKQY